MSEVTKSILRGVVVTILSAFWPLLKTTNQVEPLTAFCVCLTTNIFVLLFYSFIHSVAERQAEKARRALSVLLKCVAVITIATVVFYIRWITDVEGLYFPALLTLCHTLPIIYQALASDKAKQLSPAI